MAYGDNISRQAAIDRINKQREHLQPDIYPQDKIGDAAYRICAEFIERLPSAQPEIIHCKDCAKHNKGVGDFEVLPDGKRSWIWKDRACPLVSWRGKAQGHEFDYQYCAYAERRTE